MTDFEVYEERRKVYEAVPYERRATVSNDLHTRVAILEVQQNNHADSIFGMKESNNALVNKLDTHIINSTTRDHELQLSVGQITIAVTNLSENVMQTNSSLKTIAQMATESHAALSKWDTIVTTIAKIAGILTIVIGAVWSLYTFLESHNIAVDSKTSISPPL